MLPQANEILLGLQHDGDADVTCHQASGDQVGGRLGQVIHLTNDLGQPVGLFRHRRLVVDLIKQDPLTSQQGIEDRELHDAGGCVPHVLDRDFWRGGNEGEGHGQPG